MRENGLSAAGHGTNGLTRRRQTPGTACLVVSNLLDRHFVPDAPNCVRTGDITDIAAAEGWLYLAVVIDPFNREVLPCRAREPVRQSGLPGPSDHLRHARIDVVRQGQLLGQRAHRELLRRPQEPAGCMARTMRSSPRPRAICSSTSPCFTTGAAATSPWESCHRSRSYRTGSNDRISRTWQCVRTSGWKAKNVGHLSLLFTTKASQQECDGTLCFLTGHFIRRIGPRRC